MAATPPVACTLAPGAHVERVAWIADLNRVALRSHRQERGTLELLYAPDAAEPVAELVRHERACCAFLRFTLDATADGVRLTIAAPAEVRDGAADTAAAFFAPFLAGVGPSDPDAARPDVPPAVASPAAGWRPGHL